MTMLYVQYNTMTYRGRVVERGCVIKRKAVPGKLASPIQVRLRLIRVQHHTIHLTEVSVDDASVAGGIGRLSVRTAWSAV